MTNSLGNTGSTKSDDKHTNTHDYKINTHLSLRSESKLFTTFD